MTHTGTIHSRQLVRTLGGYPAKLYVFKMALDVFPDTRSIENRLAYLLTENPTITKGREYSIAIAWGYIEKNVPHLEITDGRVRAFDIYSYRFDKPWTECNPEIRAWFLKNTQFDSEGENCGTGTIILGEEEKLRRTTKDKEEFLKRWPDLGELGPVV